MSDPFKVGDSQADDPTANDPTQTDTFEADDVEYVEPSTQSSDDGGYAVSEEISLDTLVDLMSDAGIDNVWLDLDGDLVPETMVSHDGPFAIDEPSLDDSWATYDNYDPGVGVYDGESMSMLVPIDVEAGYPDPFVLPTTDWTTCDVYDPMTMANDWSMDGGYSTFTDTYTMPGAELSWDDSSSYYDTQTYSPGYWDTSDYYDSSSDYLDTSVAVDNWDLPATYDPSGYDPAAFDPSGYDPTGYDTSTYDTSTYDPNVYNPSGYDPTAYNPSDYSTWDPTSGDGAQQDFISYITEDYSTATDQSSYWSDQYDTYSDLSWEAWNSSVDASISGDDMAAYDFNQTSIDMQNYADQAWDYSSTSSYTSSYDSTLNTYDSTNTDGFIDYIQS